MRRWSWILVVALTLAPSGAALAQTGDAHAQAEEKFKQGIAARDKGNFRAALELFRAAQGIEPGRGKLLNIALCEEELGLLGSAMKHFQEVERQFTAGDDRIPVVKKHLDALRGRVPYLKIHVAAGAPSGTAVTLDGTPVAPASLGVEMVIDPGEHTITASAPGATERRYEVRVGTGEHRAVEVAPQAVIVAPEQPKAEAHAMVPEAASRGLGWMLGVTALGVGGASLLVGAGTGAAAMAKRAGTVKLCVKGPEMCPASAQGDIDAYYRLGAASTATFVVGGVLAATGLVLMVTGRRGEKPAAAWIAPALGPGMLGVQGRF